MAIAQCVSLPCSPLEVCIGAQKKPATRGVTGFSFSRCCSEFA